MFKYVHHVHYAIKDRDAMVNYMEKTFGMKPQRLTEKPLKCKEAYYQIGETEIQFTEPLDPQSGMGKFVAEHGSAVYHVAWGVDNLKQIAQELAAQGIKTREEKGYKEGPRGYLTSNLDRASSQGLWFQLAENMADSADKEKQRTP